MGILQNILAVIVVLGVLITIHEFGHFWVARRCGIRVLRFSVGFGRPLLMRVDRHGTEFALAAIPLGGYVRMLDEREAPVDPAEQHLAFNRQSVWKRIAVVSAGPLANFLLALVAYWLMFMVGTTTVTPMVGAVSPDSPAAGGGLERGQEIVRIEGERTRSWEEVNLALIGAIGRDRLHFETRNEGGALQQHTLNVSSYMAQQDPPRPLETLGFVPWRPATPPVIGRVLPEGAAAAAGLQAGDRIISIGGVHIDDWSELVNQVQASANRTLELQVSRNGQTRPVTLKPRPHQLDDGRSVGYIGAAAEPGQWPAQYRRELRYGPLEAVGRALHRTASMTALTVGSIRKMLTGLISPSNLSGPITIARVAGESARSGLETFIGFLAYLSISLGVLNLLPIPVLDGGHLLFYAIEAVRGRPLSDRAQAMGLRIGAALVAALMIMAFYFDLMRL
ncbi:RIP metalloprotease RseP [Kushneria phosphatilytica]|uniref:Zinc metalloprotease n=1 Tax=Kushneria phosphatilytica TaxID=657387 RepID=A0A1S1NVA6_9GAMM|nr:RIP metalloprotease RseP [Kushneria phosphatilytica]OHV10476.1 RIP metalloprotease RseP [Kushneria phosphatilytica]QEL11972.1 RIP metalloprotease RseP [Kushneria phosphatilytica]